MNFVKSLRFAVFFLSVFACAGIAAAQGPASNTNTTTSELEMTANVQTAVQLNISTGSGGATVSGSNSTGLFSINFGDVNAFGLGTPASGVSVVADSDFSGATYSSPINLTPVFSGFASGAAADVTVEAGASADQAIAREGSAANSMSEVTTTPAGVISNAASGSANTRYVGFRIARTEEAGPKTATFIYTVTVE
jgi:hypothetical protein